MPVHDASRDRPSAALVGRLRRAPHVLSTTQGDEVTLLDPQAGRYYTLNDVGSRVWALLAAGATLEGITHVIRREYDVPADGAGGRVEGDIARLLRDLLRARLIVVECEARPTEGATVSAASRSQARDDG